MTDLMGPLHLNLCVYIPESLRCQTVLSPSPIGDAKARKLAGGGPPADVYGVHPGGRRAVAAPRHKGFQSFTVAFGHGFYVAVGGVPYKSLETQTLSLFLSVGPEKYALYQAVNFYIHPFHGLLLLTHRFKKSSSKKGLLYEGYIDMLLRLVKLICLDIGTKRIGVAASDPLGMTAQGLGTIHRTTKQNDFRQILKYIREREAERLIVGIPLDEQGKEGPAAQKILKFIGELKEFLDKQNCAVPIETWDERYSTAEADSHLIGLDVSRSKRRQVIDKMAAVIILKDYMEAKAHSGS